MGEFRSRKIPDPSWLRFRPEIENSPDLKSGTLSGRARSGSGLASSRFFKCRRDFPGFSENSPNRKSEHLSGRDVTGSDLASSRFFKCRRDFSRVFGFFSENSPNRKSEQLSGRDVTGSLTLKYQFKKDLFKKNIFFLIYLF